MAELIVYAYNGLGEQLAAETLAARLPPSWRIVVGRELPTPQKDDVDLLIIAENHVFVLEEKHWGPNVKVVNGGWVVKGELRPSPVGRNAHVAKVVAGVLKKSVGGYAAASTSGHLVQEWVVLSHPKLDLDTSKYPSEDGHILLLDEAPKILVEFDKTSTKFFEVRDRVKEFVGGLKARQEKPQTLGPFSVGTEVAPVGRSRVFWGKDSDGDDVVLRAYPMDGWGPGVDARLLVKNERHATKQIADMQRSWGVEATFVDDARRWIILPIRPVPSISLNRWVVSGAVQVEDAEGLTDRAAGIVLDAFSGLADVHAKDVVHRGLSPDRVLLGKNDRVLFRDFYLAHLPTDFTVGSVLADTVDSSVPFRAPEAASLIGAATQKSDVYSLALSVLWWLNGDSALTSEDAIKALRENADTSDDVVKVLVECVASDASLRPEAAEVAERVRTLLQPPPPPPPRPTPPSFGGADDSPDQFVEGGRVGKGRYQMMHVLGQGGFATSWLAKDLNVDAFRVVKQFHDPAAAFQAKQEFDAAAKLINPRCARVWDYSPDPAYLVSEYVAGRSLKELGDVREATEADYRRIALDALDGLAYMHNEGHLHRDVSPNNIIVTDDGRAVLIDFGLAIARADAVSIAGTPVCMAPEVMAAGSWSQSADLYGLGVSLLLVMLRRPPFTGPGKAEVLPLTPEEEATWGPEGVAIINALFKLVAPDPDMRPNSAAEYADYLRTVAAPEVKVGRRAVNPTVLSLRHLYRGSSMGNAGNRGLDDEFAVQTYVDTRLDTKLTPSVIAGELDVVLLTGNPGDGKTSFLFTLRERLREAGAEDDLPPTLGGWRMKLGDRTFAAVYDASEARDGKSSDQILNEALEGSDIHTALIAINDGRLLSFFAANSDVYPDTYVAVDRYAKGYPSENSRIAVVDLKRRSVAPTNRDDDGLAGRVLEAFVAEPLWAECEDCEARGVCPILTNRNLLSGTSKRPLLELVSISHLRRKRRATFRDVRSAIAWTITGDRGCEDVHRAIDNGQDLRLAERSLAFDLAFDAGNPDYLVSEWATVDPIVLASPGVERARRDGSFGLDTSFRPGSENRQLFFDGAGVSPVGRDEVRAYRFFDEFVSALNGEARIADIRKRVLLGLSRILGAPGYDGTALALRDGESAGWAVLREIPAGDFQLDPLAMDATYVEQQSDGLRLSHKLGAIVLTLDSYELIRRAADGELLGDSGAEAVKLELSAFGNALRMTPAHHVRVVDPAGRGEAVGIVDGVITREKSSA